MDCSNDWTFRFPDVEGTDGPFEIRPMSLDYKFSRSEWGQAKAKFETEVGDMMEYHTRYDGEGALRQKEVVQICYDGEPVDTLYFKPDFARYGDQYTHLEFQDIQKSMDTGVVDNEWEQVRLEDAYRYVFNERETDLIEEIRFTKLPDDMPTYLYGQQALEVDIRRRKKIVRDIENEAAKKLVEAKYAINLDKVSPAKAILILNKRFNVQTWVDKERVLWVGYPEAAARYHIAAPNDDRVWRYNGDEVNITHPREPVRQVTVEGGWVDNPGIGTGADAIDEVISWFDSGHEGGTGDVIAHGVAYRTDIDYGESLVLKNTKAKRDALPTIAEATMRELMKQGHSGSVEINTDLSGDFTSLQKVEPGDLIRLVPNDKHFADPTATSGEFGDEPEDLGHCTSFVNNELYFITEVQHHVDDSGHWSVTLDVTMYPDVLEENMESTMRYFDPNDNAYLTEDDVFADQQKRLIESDTGT